jgi:hypothetical protein
MSSTTDRFKVDRTASNRAGVTLMNNQVGYVVANVMRGKPGVTVEEPKWQIDGFIDWNYPDDVVYSDYPAVTDATNRKILGLNAAALYGIDVPAEFQLSNGQGTPGAKEDARLVETA